MSDSKDVTLFSLIMHDDQFRKDFMDNPQRAVDKRNLDLAPQVIQTFLVVREEDLERPPSVEDEYDGPRLCLDGIGCVPGDNRKKSPPSK